MFSCVPTLSFAKLSFATLTFATLTFATLSFMLMMITFILTYDSDSMVFESVSCSQKNTAFLFKTS